jgi:hypothetical protein
MIFKTTEIVLQFFNIVTQRQTDRQMDTTFVIGGIYLLLIIPNILWAKKKFISLLLPLIRLFGTINKHSISDTT